MTKEEINLIEEIYIRCEAIAESFRQIYDQEHTESFKKSDNEAYANYSAGQRDGANEVKDAINEEIQKVRKYRDGL